MKTLTLLLDIKHAYDDPRVIPTRSTMYGPISPAPASGPLRCCGLGAALLLNGRTTGDTLKALEDLYGMTRAEAYSFVDGFDGVPYSFPEHDWLVHTLGAAVAQRFVKEPL